MPNKVALLRGGTQLPNPMPDYCIWEGDAAAFLEALPEVPLFDLVVTSPPYNIGKPYEQKMETEAYLDWQRSIIRKLLPRMSETGSLCWQVGNRIVGGEVTPLDALLLPIFWDEGMHLRNRIVWRFGHGFHCTRRFSGRYEVVLWLTKTKDYVFNLDAVRVPSKYPGKKHYKGPKKGQVSSDPRGKNPSDVWDNIPNVKGLHVEKTIHPCQFPVGLVERLILALTEPGGLVFDPFAGVASAGVAAAAHDRRFWGSDTVSEYCVEGRDRVERAVRGIERYRPHDRPIFDHKQSKLSIKPEPDDQY